MPACYLPPAGDVHACAAGKLFSPALQAVHDPRYMVNVTSSAIINAPPPDGLAQTMNVNLVGTGAIDSETKYAMLEVFDDHDNRRKVCRQGRGVRQGQGRGQRKCRHVRIDRHAALLECLQRQGQGCAWRCECPCKQPQAQVPQHRSSPHEPEHCTAPAAQP